MPEPTPLEIDDDVAALLHRALRLDGVFPEFGAGNVQQLFPLSGAYCYRLNELLIKQGEQDRDLFVVLSGRVGIFKDGTIANPLATLGAGAVLGEIALLQQRPRTATVTALEDCKIFRLRFDDLHALLDHHDELAAHLKALASQRLSR